MSRTIKVDKQAPNISYTGSWSGGASGNEVDIESASNVVYTNGTFGNLAGGGKPLAKGTGAGTANLSHLTDFTYGSKLNTTGGSNVNIYDQNASGAFTTGRYMRIVNNAKNITDPSGMNIQNIYAKSLSGTLSGLLPPPSTDAYIDPELGRFILPRPIYFSRCESSDDVIGTPEIYLAALPPTWSSSGTFRYQGFGAPWWSKWGNAFYLGNYCIGSTDGINITYDGTWYIYPVNGTMDWNKGTASYWLYQYAIQSNSGWPGMIGYGITNSVLYFGPSTYLQRYDCDYILTSNYENIYHYYQLVVNGVSQGTYNISNGEADHVYVVWDSAKGLTGGCSVRVYLNGTNILNSTASLPDASSYNIYYFIECTAHCDQFFAMWTAGNAYFTIDNIKLFNHAIDSPTWEYNGGTGREYALHNVYGSGNNYQPQITGANNGVGYFFLSADTGSLTSPGSGGDDTETLLASTTTFGAGSFGDGGVLCDNSFAALNTTTHYNYGRRLDASTTEDATYGFGSVAGGITDISNSGPLAGSKYIRLVDNALNIKNVNYPTTGAGGLKVFAQTLVGTNKNIWAPPTKDRIFVDPATGNYCFPRPSYWCKMESWGDIATPTLYNATYPPTTWYDIQNTQNVEAFIAGKFNNCWYANTWSTTMNVSSVSRNFAPLNANLDWRKGTASYYGLVTTSNPGGFWGSSIDLFWHYGSPTAMVQYSYDAIFNPSTAVYLYINGGIVSSYTPVAANTWHHFYVVWDSSGGLSGGKTVRVFIDGVERLSTTTAFTNPDFSSIFLFLQGNCSTAPYGGITNSQSAVAIDNFKVWNEVVSEDPSFEYNGGTGREDALHNIYGAANGYKPNLAAASSGVGYFRGGASSRQCIITI